MGKFALWLPPFEASPYRRTSLRGPSLSGASGFGVRECMYSARARFLRRNRQVIGSRNERHVSLGEAGSATRKGVALAPFCVATPGAMLPFFGSRRSALTGNDGCPSQCKNCRPPKRQKCGPPPPNNFKYQIELK